MLPKNFVLSIMVIVTSFILSLDAGACESCTIPRIGKNNVAVAEDRPKWFADFTTEQQKWIARDAREAHELHHQGHHIHNKTHEEFYHFILGVDPMDRLSLVAELPYVVRTSTEIESHSRLGAKESSEGLGDMILLATYRLRQEGRNALGVVGGVKLPTGNTEEKNSQGLLFEPELQPGTGSTDVPLGGTFQMFWDGDLSLRGNAMYVIRTEGDHRFEFGDLFTTSLFFEAPLFRETDARVARWGADLNYQHEQMQKEDGVTLEDSGGDVLLLGPSVTFEMERRLTVFGNFLFPVYQKMGGYHQELDYVWNAGVKVSW